MVPPEEVNATYCLRPRASKEGTDIVKFQIGMSVSIIRGEKLGREGMVVDMDEDEDTVTVMFMPDIEPVS